MSCINDSIFQTSWLSLRAGKQTECVTSDTGLKILSLALLSLIIPNGHNHCLCTPKITMQSNFCSTVYFLSASITYISLDVCTWFSSPPYTPQPPSLIFLLSFLTSACHIAVKEQWRGRSWPPLWTPPAWSHRCGPCPSCWRFCPHAAVGSARPRSYASWSPFQPSCRLPGHQRHPESMGWTHF